MSLLKRIEQGQSQNGTAALPRDASAPPASTAAPAAGGTTRMTGLNRQRVSPPGGAQRDT